MVSADFDLSRMRRTARMDSLHVTLGATSTYGGSGRKAAGRGMAAIRRSEMPSSDPVLRRFATSERCQARGRSSVSPRCNSHGSAPSRESVEKQRRGPVLIPVPSHHGAREGSSYAR